MRLPLSEVAAEPAARFRTIARDVVEEKPGVGKTAFVDRCKWLPTFSTKESAEN